MIDGLRVWKRAPNVGLDDRNAAKHLSGEGRTNRPMGDSYTLGDVVRLLDALAASTKTNFDRLESKLDRLDVRAERMEMRLDRIEMRLDRIETKFDRFETRVEALELQR